MNGDDSNNRFQRILHIHLDIDNIDNIDAYVCQVGHVKQVHQVNYVHLDDLDNGRCRNVKRLHVGPINDSINYNDKSGDQVPFIILKRLRLLLSCKCLRKLYGLVCLDRLCLICFVSFVSFVLFV